MNEEHTDLESVDFEVYSLGICSAENHISSSRPWSPGSLEKMQILKHEKIIPLEEYNTNCSYCDEACQRGGKVTLDNYVPGKMNIGYEKRKPYSREEEKRFYDLTVLCSKLTRILKKLVIKRIKNIRNERGFCSILIKQFYKKKYKMESFVNIRKIFMKHYFTTKVLKSKRVVIYIKKIQRCFRNYLELKKVLHAIKTVKSFESIKRNTTNKPTEKNNDFLNNKMDDKQKYEEVPLKLEHNPDKKKISSDTLPLIQPKKLLKSDKLILNLEKNFTYESPVSKPQEDINNFNVIDLNPNSSPNNVNNSNKNSSKALGTIKSPEPSPLVEFQESPIRLEKSEGVNQLFVDPSNDFYQVNENHQDTLELNDLNSGSEDLNNQIIEKEELKKLKTTSTTTCTNNDNYDSTKKNALPKLALIPNIVQVSSSEQVTCRSSPPFSKIKNKSTTACTSLTSLCSKCNTRRGSLKDLMRYVPSKTLVKQLKKISALTPYLYFIAKMLNIITKRIQEEYFYFIRKKGTPSSTMFYHSCIKTHFSVINKHKKDPNVFIPKLHLRDILPENDVFLSKWHSYYNKEKIETILTSDVFNMKSDIKHALKYVQLVTSEKTEREDYRKIVESRFKKEMYSKPTYNMSIFGITRFIDGVLCNIYDNVYCVNCYCVPVKEICRCDCHYSTRTIPHFFTGKTEPKEEYYVWYDENYTSYRKEENRMMSRNVYHKNCATERENSAFLSLINSSSISSKKM